ncbi:hypothetical protein [Sinorhizobium medicae]
MDTQMEKKRQGRAGQPRTPARWQGRHSPSGGGQASDLAWGTPSFGGLAMCEQGLQTFSRMEILWAQIYAFRLSVVEQLALILRRDETATALARCLWISPAIDARDMLPNDARNSLRTAEKCDD